MQPQSDLDRLVAAVVEDGVFFGVMCLAIIAIAIVEAIRELRRADKG